MNKSCHQPRFAPATSLAVVGLARGARPACERLYRERRLARLVDAELTEPVVDGAELAFFAEDYSVQLAHDVRRSVQGAVVLGRWEEKPHQWEVEGQGGELEAQPPASVDRDSGWGRAARPGCKCA